MKIPSSIARLIPRLITLALLAMPCAAHACDQCMGGKDANIRPAINGAIFFMLGMVAFMLTGIGFFIRYLARRASMPLAAHQELMISIPTHHV